MPPAGSAAVFCKPAGRGLGKPAAGPFSTTPGTAGCTERTSAGGRPAACGAASVASSSGMGGNCSGRLVVRRSLRAWAEQALEMPSSRLLATTAANVSAAFSFTGSACCASWSFSASCASGGRNLGAGALEMLSAMSS